MNIETIETFEIQTSCEYPMAYLYAKFLPAINFSIFIIINVQLTCFYFLEGKHINRKKYFVQNDTALFVLKPNK